MGSAVRVRDEWYQQYAKTTKGWVREHHILCSPKASTVDRCDFWRAPSVLLTPHRPRNAFSCTWYPGSGSAATPVPKAENTAYPQVPECPKSTDCPNVPI